MNDLPIFLQLFVRMFAFLALGAWLQTLLPGTADAPDDCRQAHLAGSVAHHASGPAAKQCAVPASNDPK
jgi:hypothetical protein